MSAMKFGKYKGRDFSEVPSSYLIWAYENIEDEDLKRLDADLQVYIKKNITWIRKEKIEEDFRLEMIALCAGDRDDW